MSTATLAKQAVEELLERIEAELAATGTMGEYEHLRSWYERVREGEQ